METLGRIILSIIVRLSSFRGKNVLPLYTCRLVHWKVSFIQRCPLFRKDTFYQRFHCTCIYGGTSYKLLHWDESFCPLVVLHLEIKNIRIYIRFYFCVLCSGELSIHVAVEMPFDIKMIDSPTHKIKMKVYTYYLKGCLVCQLTVCCCCSENCDHGYGGVVS